ncbi:MAG: SIS domain-containing protein [Candidatus Parcubacteria bacterium]|nr:SIS domain-containing protein [Candidatus Parcubacteria bacterium]
MIQKRGVNTIKEILEIPTALERVIFQDSKNINKVASVIKKAKEVYFIGSGTAGHAALEANYLFSKFGLNHSNFVPASEFSNFASFLKKNSIIVAISQGGENIDIIEAVKTAKKQGCKIIGITNEMSSTLSNLSDFSLDILAGSEKSVVATKTYINQLATIILIVFQIRKKYQKGIKLLQETIIAISEILLKENQTKIQKLSKKLKNKEDFFAIGRGLNYPTALETSLKIKEACYIHAEGLAGGEFKHGVLAMVEKGFPCIIHTSNGNNEKSILLDAKNMSTKGALIIGVGSEKKKIFNVWLKTPKVDEVISPLTNIIPIQMLAYHLSLLRNINPDKPRNLVKSVKKH